MKTKETLKTMFYTIGLLFLIWIFISWIDVTRHNALGDETYQYWVFNFFNIWEDR